MARTPIHPGEHLAEELKEIRISAAELARQIDVPVNRVTGIINGQRAITADTALRLGHWFGTSPEFWLNLQKLYELRRRTKKLATVWKSFPSSRNASVSKHDEPRNLFRADVANLLITFEFDNAILVLDTASWWRRSAAMPAPCDG